MSEQPPQQGWIPRDETAVAPAATAAAGGGGAGRRGSGPRRRRTGWRRLVPSWRMVLGGVLIAAGLVVGGFVAGYALVHIPPANAMATAQSNVYLYADGTQLARDGEVNRESVPLSQVPLSVQRAVLAAEDRNFHTDRAVDPKAMVRGAWNTLTGKGKQSGSTITQQYVKNYYLGQEQTISRKWKEFFIAIKLGREQSKSEILQGYLNTSYFGRNAYGVQAAAQAYYGRDAADLTTAQGAYLASLLNAPSAFDVTTHPENRSAALARWEYTLDGMVKKGWLSAAERASTAFPAPQSAKPATGLSGQRGYVVQAVEEHLTGHGIVDEKTLAAGGFRITTTLQRTKQDAFVEAVDDQVLSRLSPDRRKADRNVRVGGAAIDPATGTVVAMYGGVDYTRQYVNNATRRDYQVGSTFKPFVLATALDIGARTQDGRPVTPNTVYDGTNERAVQGWSGARYAPENEDGKSYGPITVQTATDKSVNAVYAQLAMDVGPADVKRTAIALGLPANTPDLSSSPSIALGAATASVLDVTQAYATLANHGRHGAYTIVAKVARGGVDVELPAADVEQVVSRAAADTTTAVLQGVVEGGTGTAAQSAGRPAAGKTGTAEEDKAAWFAGYTPQLATVVALMGQDPESGVQKPLYGAMGLPRVSGGGAPARIWGQFTGEALGGAEILGFDLEGSGPGSGTGDEGSPSASSSASDAQTPSSAAPSTGESVGATGSPGAPTGPSDPVPPAPSVDVPSEAPLGDLGTVQLPGPPDGVLRDDDGGGPGATDGGTGLLPSTRASRRAP
ncbi:transglycosylase domain-containing protein [Streptomyces sp. NPDC047315]|uniref:transglycosylase domain-containing protein n=1 Tax=Streptomyces sp. NPDC047315 TaxID=3155142 RepID=UPI0033DF763E